MKLQGVIFDLDGVITDSAHLHFQACSRLPLKLASALMRSLTNS